MSVPAIPGFDPSRPSLHLTPMGTSLARTTPKTIEWRPRAERVRDGHSSLLPRGSSGTIFRFPNQWLRKPQQICNMSSQLEHDVLSDSTTQTRVTQQVGSVSIGTGALHAGNNGADGSGTLPILRTMGPLPTWLFRSLYIYPTVALADGCDFCQLLEAGGRHCHMVATSATFYYASTQL